ncbi:MAG: phosphopentomutase [Oscillospiraceae bacterium]|nr:phosphopentomutase [Oscillospiraceae bacterium]
MDINRVFLIVLDSVGAGELPDAAEYGDKGSHTLKALHRTGKLNVPNMEKLGLFNISGIDLGEPFKHPIGAYGKMTERSAGKDTTIGHWEIAGIVSEKPFPTYPNGFPQEILDELTKRTGRKCLCNKPYSGTDVIVDYGKEHMETGGLIVYTSADSVFQIAAHEKVVPIQELYRCCQTARDILQGEHGVCRVIARPFIGEYPNFTRTTSRHDFSLTPPVPNMLYALENSGLQTITVGKIYDIFAGQNISAATKTKTNLEGMQRVLDLADSPFRGIVFTNLVDFDMLYGHRNDVEGYTNAMNEFDIQLGKLMEKMGGEDLLIITADHGCDPSAPGTDHSREYVPLLVYGRSVRPGVDLGIRETFADVSATILDIFSTQDRTAGTSFLPEILGWN